MFLPKIPLCFGSGSARLGFRPSDLPAAFWFINREKQGLKTNGSKDSVYQQFATQDLLVSVTAVLKRHQRWTL